jgi:hypothetical protein
MGGSRALGPFLLWWSCKWIKWIESSEILIDRAVGIYSELEGKKEMKSGWK